jgi:hypothetical protein
MSASLIMSMLTWELTAMLVCERKAMLMSGRRRCVVQMQVHWHSMPWCRFECEVEEVRALPVSACCEQTLCGSAQGKCEVEGRSERVGARDWANT